MPSVAQPTHVLKLQSRKAGTGELRSTPEVIIDPHGPPARTPRQPDREERPAAALSFSGKNNSPGSCQPAPSALQRSGATHGNQ